MTTKERIIEEALTLFSVKGYKGTSVKNIADAVNIKDSSLYKHFGSKQEIFDTIVKKMDEKIADMSSELGMPDGSDMKQAGEKFGTMTLEEVKTLTKKVFLFYLEDEFMSRFWRMANIEQYQNSEIYEVYRNFFMEKSLVYQTALFSAMIEQGILENASPELMAMNFYAPLFFLLSKYNGHPEGRQEAIGMLERMVEEFFRIYGRNK